MPTLRVWIDLVT